MRDPFPWPPFARLVRQGESLGYDAVFLPEIGGKGCARRAGRAGRRDGGAPAGDRRHPDVVAHADADRDGRRRGARAIVGRLVLGIGTGPAVPGALDRLRELVATLRRLFAGEPVEIEGRASRLSLVPDEPVPIWISALGPRADAPGGRDRRRRPAELVLARARRAPPGRQLREGAESAGRDPADVTVAVYVRASLGASDRGSVRALQAAAGEYASYPAYARQFSLMGLEEECRAGRGGARVGSARGCAGRPGPRGCPGGRAGRGAGAARGYREAGADLPVVYPVATPSDPIGSVARTLIAAVPV